MGLRPPSAGSGGAQQVFVQQTAPSVAYPCIWVVTDATGAPTGEIRAENAGAFPVADALGIPATLIDALGDLVVGTGNDTAGRLPHGTTGQVLAVNTDGSLHWIDPPATGGGGIAPTIFDALGDLIVASAADTPARLARGTTGQVLTVQADGTLAWATPAAGGGGTPADQSILLRMLSDQARTGGWLPSAATGTATTTSGSNQLTSVVVAGTGGRFIDGASVTGAGIPAGTTIVSGGGTGTLVMSANATASASSVTITSGPALAETVMRRVVASSTSPVSGQLRVAGGMVIPGGRTVRAISFVSSTTAPTTPVNQWFVLIDRATGAVLATTIDDTTAAWPANTMKTLPLATTVGGATPGGSYTPTNAIEVYIGICVVAGAMLNLQAVGSNANLGNLPPLISGTQNGVSLTGPSSQPTTMAQLTVASALPYAFVS